MTNQTTRNFLEGFMIKNYLIMPVGVTRSSEDYPELYNELQKVAASREYKNILNLLNSYHLAIIEEGPILRDDYVGMVAMIDTELDRLK